MATSMPWKYTKQKQTPPSPNRAAGLGQSPILDSTNLDGPERFYAQKFSAAVGFYIGFYSFTEGKVYAPTLLLIAGKDDWIKQGRRTHPIRFSESARRHTLCWFRRMGRLV